MAEEAAGKKLYDAAAKGDVTTLQEVLEQDPYLLDEVSFACSRNLLHIGSMQEQVGIVEEVLKRNPQLARDLDSQKSSPLHIAAAKGNVEIAKRLLSSGPEMCWSRDCQGMNPIHIAAMKGHVEILEELVRLDFCPAMERVHRGQTALHLCVKHRQLRALQVLVETVGELICAKDDDGETILHWAVRCKQVEIIRYLVENTKIIKQSTNSMGRTALGILKESCRDATYLEMRDLLDRRWLNLPIGALEFFNEMSEVIMVVVVLIATMAFQAAISPPGGVWQDNSSEHRAGEAIMASNHPKIYKNFVRANTVAFVSSLITIFLIATRLASEIPIFLSAVFYTMLMSLTSIAVSYGASITVITPTMETLSLGYVIEIVVAVTLSIFGSFLIGVSFSLLLTRWKIIKWFRHNFLRQRF
ncbi:hypothetical protein C2S51_035394 [Perilla frutescens var. frutescens]|nr:hypothetical protein C2S51_035394 [Perilla frutescens var. frutescens]